MEFFSSSASFSRHLTNSGAKITESSIEPLCSATLDGVEEVMMKLRSMKFYPEGYHLFAITDFLQEGHDHFEMP